ncbi:MAG: leucine-rich repeat domain-containing protein [Microbacter sp.]
MKKLLLLSLFLSLVIAGHAQVSQTVNVTAGGGLSAAITAAGGSLSTITNLTVTGTIDASDFVTLRDNMPALTTLDISGATIAAYTGTGGTYTDTSYPANTVPYDAFYNDATGTGKTTLTSITLPNSLTSIGNGAFELCTGLTSIPIPSSVTSIGSYAFNACSGLTSATIPPLVTSIGVWAFAYCTSLTSIPIPSSVTSIGSYAFAYCSGLFTVDANNPNYSSNDGILFDKNQTTLIQFPTSKTGSYAIPSSVTSISDNAFGHCSGLTSITIPSSVTFIGNYVFSGCTGLTSLYANATTPIDLSSSKIVFQSVPTSTCILYVPSNSVTAYANANQWSAFTHIVGFTATAVTTANTPTLKAFSQNGQLIVTGISQGDMLTIYTVQGTTIYSQRADGNQAVVNLPAQGIYIVKAGAQSVKVVN